MEYIVNYQLILQKIKNSYKSYLLSLNPNQELLNINSDINIWKNIAYFWKTVYQFELNPSIIPENICIDIKMDTPPTYTSLSECRSVKDGINTITPKYELSDASDLLKTNSKIFMIVIGVILCVCLCISSVAGFFLMKKSSGKSRGGYQYYHY